MKQFKDGILYDGEAFEVMDKILIPKYKNKIKMIYIDPPYNTSRKYFVYNDSFKKDKNDKYGHKAWKEFIYPKLQKAKELLKDDGVIFVSIGDREQAHLRIMMDEIFNEANFLAQVIWERAYAPKNDAIQFSTTHEYILVYAKNIDKVKCNGLKRTLKQNKQYKNPDNDHRGFWKSADFTTVKHKGGYYYPIKTNSGNLKYPTIGRNWLYSEEKYKELLADNRIYFGKKGTALPSRKIFLSEVRQSLSPRTVWSYTEVGSTHLATKYLKNVFGNLYFNYPKPVKLIKRMLKLYTTYNTNDLILDFFAGSGTTGDAVMQLNAEDNGNRKFILVQLQEPLPENSIAYKEGLKTVYDITQKRLEIVEERLHQ